MVERAAGGRSRRTATVTVLFCDLVGSTERQARVGDEAADEFRGRFFTALAGVVVQTGGKRSRLSRQYGDVAVNSHSSKQSASRADNSLPSSPGSRPSR
jgi:class 3 adenylate cyclase